MSKNYFSFHCVEGGGVEPPAHCEAFQGIIAALVGCRSTYFGDGPHPLIPILPVCTFYPGFYLPNMSILIVLFVLETSEPHGGLGMNNTNV